MLKIIRTIILLIAISLTQVAANAQPQYPVASIPEEMRQGVNVVIRERKTSFRILSQAKAIEKERLVITIFNEKAKDNAEFFIFHEKLLKVRNIAATVYDGQGAVLKKLKQSDITDHSYAEGDLFNDNRYKAIDLAQQKYPYTIELEYERAFNFLYYVPEYFPLRGGNVSTQHAVYSLEYPSEQKDLLPRYTTRNISTEPVRTKMKDGFLAIQWTFDNLRPIKEEPYGYDERELLPRIEAAPSLFEYEGYVGNMTDWNQFGVWIGSLLKGRNALPEATKEMIRDLTRDLPTTEEKVKAVYSYLQNKTRYVSIQLGIGGYQPFDASTVDKVGYGDCKALSNYTIALLEAIGIKGYYTLIASGYNEPLMNENFPGSQFNHVIAFVPLKNDTLWMECTSKTNPFNFPGGFTGSRKALAITDAGAKVVWTPSYSAAQNIQSTVADVVIDDSGNATGQIKMVCSGLQYENNGLSAIFTENAETQQRWLQRTVDIPNLEVKSFSFENKKERIPSATVKMELALNRFAFTSGKRFYIIPNLMNRWTNIPGKVENRTQPIIKTLSYTDGDTIRYHLPETLYPEFVPEPVSVKSRFGEYHAEYEFRQGSVVYRRKMVIYKGAFPKESYNELIEFYRDISKADNSKIVFLHKS